MTNGNSRGRDSHRVVADGRADAWSALGTSSHFAVVESSPTGAVEVEVHGPPEAQLQVTVVPLGADLPRLDLKVNKLRGPTGELCMRARVTGAEWHAREALGDLLGAAHSVGQSALERFSVRTAGHVGYRGDLRVVRIAGGRRTFVAADPPARCVVGIGPLVIKVIGADEKGRRIAAWAEVAADPEIGRAETKYHREVEPSQECVDPNSPAVALPRAFSFTREAASSHSERLQQRSRPGIGSSFDSFAPVTNLQS